MFESSVDKTIIESVLRIGATLELDVIAEGVETKEHFKTLEEMGCKHYQGYYFARPQQVNTLKFSK